MKKIYMLSLPAAMVVILLTAFSGKDARYPNGSPAGYTGSPGDGKDCTQCHGGSASPVIGWITSNIPDDGYLPGETYDITATASGSGDKGFLVSPQTTDGSILGELIAGSGSKLVGSGGYITQTSSTSGNPKTWNFQWTAPVSGTGTVTFYGAFTVNKPVTKLCTMAVIENVSIGIGENKNVRTDIYPNPFVDRLHIDTREHGMKEVELFDNSGRIVKRFSADQMGPLASIDLQELKTGIYFIKVYTEKGYSTNKIIKR